MINAMFALVMFTMLVGLYVVKVRRESVRLGQVDKRYYQLMQGYEASDKVVKSTRCINNLYEVPVLFYAVGILYVVLGLESVVALVFAWLFVLLRVVHAYIHLTYNNVMHRMYAFSGGVLCVCILWVNLMLQRV